MTARKRFSTAAPTPPNADESVPDVQTPRRPALQTSAPRAGGRSAFTWRLTPEEANRIDGLVLRLRTELGRARLDRATMLTALVEIADESPAVFGALVARLQDV